MWHRKERLLQPLKQYQKHRRPQQHQHLQQIML
jgi:hypothetical protein